MPTLIRRDSSDGSDYVSAALFGSAGAFGFIQEALRLGILKLVIVENP